MNYYTDGLSSYKLNVGNMCLSPEETVHGNGIATLLSIANAHKVYQTSHIDLITGKTPSSASRPEFPIIKADYASENAVPFIYATYLDTVPQELILDASDSEENICILYNCRGNMGNLAYNDAPNCVIPYYNPYQSYFHIFNELNESEMDKTKKYIESILTNGWYFIVEEKCYHSFVFQGAMSFVKVVGTYNITDKTVKFYHNGKSSPREFFSYTPDSSHPPVKFLRVKVIYTTSQYDTAKHSRW